MRSRSAVSPRRRLVALCICVAVGLIGCGSAVATPTPSPSPTPSPVPTPTPSPAITAASDLKAPLRDLSHPRFFGTAVLMPWLDIEQEYTDGTAEQFDSITPENAMTWAVVEPTEGELDWSWPDAVVEWAGTRGIAVRGFPLVWDQQLPAWLTNGTFDDATLETMLQDHVTALVSRYAGQVVSWDVVTDPFNSDGSLRRTIWEKAIGPDYIAKAFLWAHAADPKAKLYLNDSDVGLDAKSDAVYELVKTLRRQGVPIDGVAMEAHLDATVRTSYPAAVVSNLQRFAALGVDVVISQLDVRVHTPLLEGELDRQTNYYVAMISACFSVPGCSGVTVWEWSDRYSWVPREIPGEGAADLWDSNFNPKKVVDAVKQAILASRT